MSEDILRIDVETATLTRDELVALLNNQPTPHRFIGVDFSSADLSRLTLNHCEFQRCVLIGTSFLGSALESTRWKNCRGAQASFEAANLLDATFASCDFNNSRWLRAKLSHARFTECKLTGANLAHCDSLGLTFSDTLLRAALLSGISFCKSTLQNLDFADADLTHTDFRDSIFEGGSLAHARIFGAKFAGADLRGADLSGFELNDAKRFKGATISRAQAAMFLAELGVSVI